MTSKPIQEKGLLAKLLEKGIRILLKKECKEIGIIKIEIIASSIQIIKGVIKKIYINAIVIDYKDIVIDEIELEANDVKIIFKIKNRELILKQELLVKFKISFSEKSIKTILFSTKWNFIGDKIAQKILNQSKFQDIKIMNNKIQIKAYNESKAINFEEKIDLKIKNSNLYLENKVNKKSIKLPIEDKVRIQNVSIENDIIIISAVSTISFN